MAVVKIDVIIFQIPAGKHVNQVKQVRCAKEYGNRLRLLVTVLWTGRRRVSLAARGAMGVGQLFGSTHVHQRQHHGRCLRFQDENRLVGMEAHGRCGFHVFIPRFSFHFVTKILSLRGATGYDFSLREPSQEFASASG